MVHPIKMLIMLGKPFRGILTDSCIEPIQAGTVNNVAIHNL